MKEISELIDLLTQKTKLVAMLAPSFPIIYNYPSIVGELKRLGFEYVVEVSAGAKRTNEELINALKQNPNSRFITSPCPSLVRMVRNKYPNLKKYLAFAADSPMIATAKIVKEKWPEYKPVFIGPCVAKKFESSEDYPDLNILVLTFREMNEVFKHYGLRDDLSDSTHTFDIANKDTRIYPIAGGLLETSSAKNILREDQIQEVSGWQRCNEALLNFEKNINIRFLDILFCEGGCINGPGIESQLSPDERKAKIISFQNSNN